MALIYQPAVFAAFTLVLWSSPGILLARVSVGAYSPRRYCLTNHLLVVRML